MSKYVHIQVEVDTYVTYEHLIILRVDNFVIELIV